MTRPAILVVAAGPSQLPVYSRLRQKDIHIIGVDRDVNAPGFVHCDETIVASTYDAQAIIEMLSKTALSNQIVQVINRSSGPPVVTTANVCEHLGIDHLPVTTAMAAVNKDQFNALCLAHHLPVPLCHVVQEARELQNTRLPFPCVVKPSLSLVGKSGVTYVEDSTLLQSAVTRAKMVSQNGFVNVEQFVPGRDISLMSVVTQGKLVPICMMDEINSREKDGTYRGVGFAVPSLVTNTPMERAVLDLARKTAKALQINTAPFMMSCRVDEKCTPHLIELHLDIGGDLVLEKLMPSVTNTDVLGLVLDLLLGTSVNPMAPIQIKPGAIVYDPGDELNRLRAHRIITASTRQSLEQKIKISRKELP